MKGYRVEYFAHILEEKQKCLDAAIGHMDSVILSTQFSGENDLLEKCRKLHEELCERRKLRRANLMGTSPKPPGKDAFIW